MQLWLFERLRGTELYLLDEFDFNAQTTEKVYLSNERGYGGKGRGMRGKEGRVTHTETRGTKRSWAAEARLTRKKRRDHQDCSGEEVPVTNSAEADRLLPVLKISSLRNRIREEAISGTLV